MKQSRVSEVSNLWLGWALEAFGFLMPKYVRFQLIVQNVVSPQPGVKTLGISLVLLNLLGCNCGW